MNVHHSVQTRQLSVGWRLLTLAMLSIVLKLHYLLQRHQRDLAATPWLFTLKHSQWLLARTAQSFLVAAPLLPLLCT